MSKIEIRRHINLGFWSDYELPTDKDYRLEKIDNSIKAIVAYCKRHETFRLDFITRERIIIRPQGSGRSSVQFHGIGGVWFINTQNFGYVGTHLEHTPAYIAMAEQKFKSGSRVFIRKKLPREMSHFTSGCWAKVLHSYYEAFGDGDSSSYALMIDGYGFSSWYHDENLVLSEEEDV